MRIYVPQLFEFCAGMGIAFYMAQQLVQIVTAWTCASAASPSTGRGPVEQWLQAAGQEEVWRVVWTQPMLGMTRAEAMAFADWHQRAGRTITITEAWLEPPTADRIYRLQ